MRGAAVLRRAGRQRERGRRGAERGPRAGRGGAAAQHLRGSAPSLRVSVRRRGALNRGPPARRGGEPASAPHAFSVRKDSTRARPRAPRWSLERLRRARNVSRRALGRRGEASATVAPPCSTTALAPAWHHHGAPGGRRATAVRSESRGCVGLDWQDGRAAAATTRGRCASVPNKGGDGGSSYWRVPDVLVHCVLVHYLGGKASSRGAAHVTNNCRAISGLPAFPAMAAQIRALSPGLARSPRYPETVSKG